LKVTKCVPGKQQKANFSGMAHRLSHSALCRWSNDTTSLDVRSLLNVIDLGSQMPGSVSTNRTLRFVRLFS
jgi:hypothetical protein